MSGRPKSTGRILFIAFLFGLLIVSYAVGHAYPNYYKGEENTIVVTKQTSGCLPGPAASCAGADLRGMNFTGANFQLADLENVSLQHADLQNANLYYADLTNANLTDANLKGANLQGAVTADTDFSGAIFCDTIMPGSNDPINNADC